MTENPDPKTSKDSFSIPGGIDLTFRPLMAGDIIDAVKQLECSLEEANPFEASLVLSWRSAVRGGFEGTYRDFIDAIPMTDVAEVVAIASPFLGSAPTSK